MVALRDASELLYPSIYAAIMSLDIDREGKDGGAAKLALRYARLIDEASEAKQANVLRWLGPELLKVLESLGATPAARAAITGRKGGPAKEPPDVLVGLKSRRRGA